MHRTLDGFAAAYNPDPEMLARLAPPTTPVLSALGAGVVRAAQTHTYEVYAYDLVAVPDIPDPRMHGKTALDGHVDHEALARNSEYIDSINAHYQEGLTPEFYAKHGLSEGLSFSGILDHAHRLLRGACRIT